MSILEYAGAAAASAVIMSHTLRKQKVVFVEGIHDGRLLKTAFEDSITPIAARGMEGVVSAVKVINEFNASNKKAIDVLGFIDRDYLGLSDTHNVLDIGNVVTTEHRDIELDLFHTPAFKKLLEEKASQRKWDCEQKVLNELLDILKDFSLLRAYNAKKLMNWDFKGIDLTKYVATSGEINTKRLESAFKQKNRINTSEWHDFEEWALSSDVCVRSITRGHDLACVFGQLLRKKLGSRKKEEVSSEIIEENLRLAIERKFLEIYCWFFRISDWIHQNSIQQNLVPSRS